MAIKRAYAYQVFCDQDVTNTAADKTITAAKCKNVLNVMVPKHKPEILQLQVPYAATSNGWHQGKQKQDWWCPQCMQKWLAEQTRKAEGEPGLVGLNKPSLDEIMEEAESMTEDKAS